MEKLNEAFEEYSKLLEKIKSMYAKSDEYLIPGKPELDDILDEANSYIYNVFNCIANASDGVLAPEKLVLDKIASLKKESDEVRADEIIESTFDEVPKYIQLATSLDKLANTNYAKELTDDTLKICKKVMDIDGNTYADESSFTYSFIGMLEKYIKDRK